MSVVSAVFADDRRGWVVGEEGLLARTDDGGASFTVLEGPEEPAPWKEQAFGPRGAAFLRRPRGSINGIALSAGALFVSSPSGVWRSLDGGVRFQLVLENPWSPHACMRMASLGRSVAVACSGFEATLFLSSAGGPFRPVPVPRAMHLTSVEFESESALVAVGSHELLIRATAAGGRIAYRSANVDAWLAMADRIAAGMRPDPEGGQVIGTVRDEQGSPVAGALVKKHGGHHGEGYKEAQTDARGGFRLGREHEAVAFVVEKDGFAPLNVSRKIEARGPTRIDLVVARPVGLSGTLVGADGVPLGKAQLLLRPAPSASGAHPEGTRSIGLSREDGTFELPAVAPGEYELAQPYSLVAQTRLFKFIHEAVADGSVRSRVERAAGRKLCQELGVTVAGAPLALPIRFADQPSIRGRVEDSAGHRIAGARVSAESNGRCPMHETVAGLDGSFAIERPDPGSYRVWAQLPEGERASKERPGIVHARPGDDQLVLVVARE